MDLDAYQAAVTATARRPGRSEEPLTFPLVGLASEVGSCSPSSRETTQLGLSLARSRNGT